MSKEMEYYEKVNSLLNTLTENAAKMETQILALGKRILALETEKEEHFEEGDDSRANAEKNN